MNPIQRRLLVLTLLVFFFSWTSVWGEETTGSLPATSVAKDEKMAAKNERKDQRTIRKDERLLNLDPPVRTVSTANQLVFEISNDNMKPKNKIDEVLAVHLKKIGLEPAPLCSDAVFVRRVYLDLQGRIPTTQEVVPFLMNQSPDKRAKLIDLLLEEERFNDYWGMKWSDLLRIKAEFPINLWPNGAAVYHRWVQNALRENMPYDQFARTLLMASGSNFRYGPANFYRAVQIRDSQSIAATVGQVFLGIETEELPEDQQINLAKFFSRVAYKGSAQWKEELVYWDRKPLDSPDVIFPDGTKATVEPNQDPREVFTNWLIRPENKAFNHNIANRIWYWLFGIGIVHEPDNFGDDNPPVCPELLDYLADELVASKYDLRHLYRLILNSRTWQQSFIQEKYNPEVERNFAVYPIRRLDAEVLQDAIIQIFKLRVTYMSEVPEPYAYLPAQLQTVEIADASITSSFLEMFGRSTRDTGTEVDRNNDITAAQELFFINSNEVNQWVKGAATMIATNMRRAQTENANANRNRAANRNTAAGIMSLSKGNAMNGTESEMVSLRRFAESPWQDVGADGTFAAHFLWLSILSRLPTDQEKEVLHQELSSGRNKAGVIEDVIWSLLNSKEFLCHH